MTGDGANLAPPGAPALANLRALTMASAQWSFPPATVDAGRGMVSRLLYNADAVACADVSSALGLTSTSPWFGDHGERQGDRR